MASRRTGEARRVPSGVRGDATPAPGAARGRAFRWSERPAEAPEPTRPLPELIRRSQRATRTVRPASPRRSARRPTPPTDSCRRLSGLVGRTPARPLATRSRHRVGTCPTLSAAVPGMRAGELRRSRSRAPSARSSRPEEFHRSRPERGQVARGDPRERLETGRERVEPNVPDVVHAPRGLERRGLVVDRALQLLRALAQFLHQRPVRRLQRVRDRGRQLRERGALLLEAMELLEREHRRQEAFVRGPDIRLDRRCRCSRRRSAPS